MDGWMHRMEWDVVMIGRCEKCYESNTSAMSLNLECEFLYESERLQHTVRSTVDVFDKLLWS
jgi:hypothetical protein